MEIVSELFASARTYCTRTCAPACVCFTCICMPYCARVFLCAGDCVCARARACVCVLMFMCVCVFVCVRV